MGWETDAVARTNKIKKHKIENASEFNINSRCKKCGSNKIGCLYYSSAEYIIDTTGDDDKDWYRSPEFLVKTCVCGYSWYEKVADA